MGVTSPVDVVSPITDDGGIPNSTITSAPVLATLSSSQVTMTWGPSTDNVAVTGYQVERCSGAGCATFAVIGSTPGTTTTYTDATVLPSTSYTYRV
jgi:hypothetical protein